MGSCMESRSNRFCVRISVPDPALVYLQVAFDMRGLRLGLILHPKISTFLLWM